MGKNKNKENETEMKNEEKGEGKNERNLTVVLKVDFHCEGCVLKIIKSVKKFEGVEKVVHDEDTNKLTIIGKVDPMKLKLKVEQKTRKSVQLVSPVPKKDNGNGKNGGEGEKQQKENENKKKEPPATTAILKVHLHCEGCIQKIYKIITKNTGYKEMKMDMEKDLVTVTGTMDMKELVETLKKQLKKDVEIVPPPKKKEGGGGGGGGGDNVVNGKNVQQEVQYGYPYMDMYPAVHVDNIFSDENVNACSIM